MDKPEEKARIELQYAPVEDVFERKSSKRGRNRGWNQEGDGSLSAENRRHENGRRARI